MNKLQSFSEHSSSPDWLYIIPGLVILVGLFLLVRELNAWFWKINQVLDTLKQINEKMDKYTREK